MNLHNTPLCLSGVIMHQKVGRPTKSEKPDKKCRAFRSTFPAIVPGKNAKRPEFRCLAGLFTESHPRRKVTVLRSVKGRRNELVVGGRPASTQATCEFPKIGQDSPTPRLRCAHRMVKPPPASSGIATLATNTTENCPYGSDWLRRVKGSDESFDQFSCVLAVDDGRFHHSSSRQLRRAHRWDDAIYSVSMLHITNTAEDCLPTGNNRHSGNPHACWRSEFHRPLNLVSPSSPCGFLRAPLRDCHIWVSR
jgi:hypothetical protein